MNFGQAWKDLKLSRKVARSGWNGKGIFIYLVEGRNVNIESLKNEAAKHLNVDSDINRGKRIKISSHIDMKASDDAIVVGWLASQVDMIADDWYVVYP